MSGEVVYLAHTNRAKDLPYTTLINLMLTKAGYGVYQSGNAFAIRASSDQKHVARVHRAALREADAVVLIWDQENNQEVLASAILAVNEEKPLLVLAAEEPTDMLRAMWREKGFVEFQKLEAPLVKRGVEWIMGQIEAGLWNGEEPPEALEALIFEKTVGEAQLPTKVRDSDAGFDMYTVGGFTVNAGETRRVRCGVKVALKKGEWGLLTGRSSTLLTTGLMVYPGVVDSDYRGELMIVVHNTTGEAQRVEKGQRLAQLVLMENRSQGRVAVEGSVGFEAVGNDRGEKGFGSSGA